MNCRICDSNEMIEFLDLGKQPLANKYPLKEEFATEEFHRLGVCFCPKCKTVQLNELISREQMFVDYYYLSSVNKALVRHFESLANQLHQQGRKFVVDIGSNDGILLKPLKALHIRALGVEPSKNVSQIALDAGLDTINAFFNKQSVQSILADYCVPEAPAHGKPDVIVASSVFTHLEDPKTFVDDVQTLLDDKGIFIIEVEYIKNILDNIQFERFYFDRIFYYSLTSLVNLLSQHGMKVVDAEEIEPHGGSLRVTAVKNSNLTPVGPNVAKYLNSEGSLTIERLNSFTQDVKNNIEELKAYLTACHENKINVGGYGAPARVATICNYGGIGPNDINYIVDDSPLKQNRYSPGTHIPIVPKLYLDNNPVDLLIVFAYEYMDDIRTKTENKYKYMIPIPPRVLE